MCTVFSPHVCTVLSYFKCIPVSNETIPVPPTEPPTTPEPPQTPENTTMASEELASVSFELMMMLETGELEEELETEIMDHQIEEVIIPPDETTVKQSKKNSSHGETHAQIFSASKNMYLRKTFQRHVLCIFMSWFVGPSFVYVIYMTHFSNVF